MIRLVVVDVDGCLTAGEGQPLDFQGLARVARANTRSLSDPSVPAVTLCTGRPAPYVEVMHQVVAGHVPALYEHGCGMLVPSPYGFKTHPRITPEVEAEFDAAMRLISDRL